MSLNSEYPAWMFGLCILLALAYSVLLYTVRKPVFSPRMNILLFALRFLVVLMIAMLLLNPFVKGLQKRSEKPVVLLAHDNSTSLLLNPDSTFYRQQFPELYQQFAEELSAKFQVEKYTFGSDLRSNMTPDFSEQSTNFGPVFLNIPAHYRNKNMAAMVLLSDGIYNTGINPLFLLSDLFFPVYTVALGDTVIKPDISVFDLRYNRVVSGRNDFPVEATIQVLMAKGQSGEVNLYMNDVLLSKKSFSIASDRFSSTMQFVVRDAAPGLHRMRIVTNTLPGEVVVQNNVREFYVEIIDKRPRVLIMAASPHPDLGALVAALGDTYEVELLWERQSTVHDIDADLLILHQLPSEGGLSAFAVELLQANSDMSLLLIPGTKTSVRGWNEIQSAFRLLNTQQPGMVESYPSVNINFSLFNLSQELTERINQFPPLMVRLGGLQQEVSAINLLHQKIRGVVTPQALFAFGAGNKRKIGVLAGSGIWRWRHFDFQRNGSHEAFNILMTKTVNYLVVNDDDNPLRIQVAQEIPFNTDVRIEAELINKSLERNNEPELSIEISQTETGIVFPFVFNRFKDIYQLNAGRFDEGLYRYVARVSMPEGDIVAEGNFRIVAGSLEARTAVADHGLMEQIAAKTGGELYYPADILQLAGKLNSNETYKTVVHFSERFEPLISKSLLLLLIILMLSAEWLLRKSNGSY